MGKIIKLTEGGIRRIVRESMKELEKNDDNILEIISNQLTSEGYNIESSGVFEPKYNSARIFIRNSFEDLKHEYAKITKICRQALIQSGYMKKMYPIFRGSGNGTVFESSNFEVKLTVYKNKAWLGGDDNGSFFVSIERNQLDPNRPREYL